MDEVLLVGGTDAVYQLLGMGSVSPKSSRPLVFAFDVRHEQIVPRTPFAGVVVPRRLNLKDGYDGGLVVRDRDFGSGPWAPSSQQ